MDRCLVIYIVWWCWRGHKRLHYGASWKGAVLALDGVGKFWILYSARQFAILLCEVIGGGSMKSLYRALQDNTKRLENQQTRLASLELTGETTTLKVEVAEIRADLDLQGALLVELLVKAGETP